MSKTKIFFADFDLREVLDGIGLIRFLKGREPLKRFEIYSILSINKLRVRAVGNLPSGEQLHFVTLKFVSKSDAHTLIKQT